ncbi:MAG: hypothetical protein QHJ73_08995, partial [Armatimonadota bacterium]|nr:hypothetical protein [Armatimonadota bacterium]
MVQVLKEVVFAAAALPWRDFFDILLSTVIIYYVVMAIKGTRAVQLAWGLVLLFLFAQVAERVQFRTLSLLLGTVATPGATVAIVILFYPELRHAGRSAIELPRTELRPCGAAGRQRIYCSRKREFGQPQGPSLFQIPCALRTARRAPSKPPFRPLQQHDTEGPLPVLHRGYPLAHAI